MDRRNIELVGAARFVASASTHGSAKHALVNELTLAADEAKTSGRIDDFVELTYAALSVDRDHPRTRQLASAALAMATDRASKTDETGDSHAAFERWLDVLRIIPGDNAAISRVVKIAADLSVDAGPEGEFELYRRIVLVTPRSAGAVRKLISSALRSHNFRPAIDALATSGATDVALDMYKKLTKAAFAAARAAFREERIVEAAEILISLNKAGFTDAKFDTSCDSVRRRLVRGLRAALTDDAREEAARHADPLTRFEPLTTEEIKTLARYLGKWGDPRDAMLCAARLRDLEPANARRWFDLSRAQQRAGEKGAAQKSIRRAMELDPKDEKIAQLAERLLA